MQKFLSFDVSGKAVFMRLLKNKLLAIPTFGLYRFWGKTHLRRLLWQSVRIGDDRLTYHGTAKELFIGFLIAMVLLMIVFGVLTFVLQLVVARGSAEAAISQLLNGVLLVLFWQFAKYRLWRYRLSRTSYRTIRFYQSGSAFKYTGLFAFWGLASLLTLGWLYPVMRKKLTEYRLNQMAFGDQHFQFAGSTRKFYQIYWPFIAAVNAYVFIPIFFILPQEAFRGIANGQALSPGMQQLVYFGAGVGILLMLGVAVLWVIAKVKEFNYTAGSTSFSGTDFTADLPVKRVFKTGVIGILVAVAAYSFVATLFGIGAATNSGFFITLGFISMFVAILLVDLIVFMVLYIPIARLMSEHIYISNSDVFKDVAVSSENSPKYGEGLADALDVGAF